MEGKKGTSIVFSTIKMNFKKNVTIKINLICYSISVTYQINSYIHNLYIICAQIYCICVPSEANNLSADCYGNLPSMRGGFFETQIVDCVGYSNDWAHRAPHRACTKTGSFIHLDKKHTVGQMDEGGNGKLHTKQ